jgi:hypothetical protein
VDHYIGAAAELPICQPDGGFDRLGAQQNRDLVGKQKGEKGRENRLVLPADLLEITRQKLISGNQSASDPGLKEP